MPDAQPAGPAAVQMQPKPFGVVVIGFLYMFLGLWRLLSGFMLMMSALAIAFSGPTPEGITSGMVLAIALVYLIIGVIDMVLSGGVFQGKQWAYMLSLIFALIGIIGAFSDAWYYGFNAWGLVALIFGLIVPLAIIWMLMQPDVKKHFGKA
jgi:hypothetical protein